MTLSYVLDTVYVEWGGEYLDEYQQDIVATFE